MSPYDEALHWIKQHRGTGSSVSLSKLLLSLWNADDFPFSVAGCLGNLDGERTDLALRMISDYAARGETQDLVDAGHEVYKLNPGLAELGEAARDAMYAVRRRWEDERERLGEDG